MRICFETVKIRDLTRNKAFWFFMPDGSLRRVVYEAAVKSPGSSFRCYLFRTMDGTTKELTRAGVAGLILNIKGEKPL